MSKPTGGPAFPVAYWDKDQMRFLDTGVTIRDYFAAKALQGFCASMSDQRFEDILNEIAGGANECKVSLLLADKMLAERDK